MSCEGCQYRISQKDAQPQLINGRLTGGVYVAVSNPNGKGSDEEHPLCKILIAELAPSVICVDLNTTEANCPIATEFKASQTAQR